MFPFFSLSSTEWIATIGQLISADHCPPLEALGVTAFDGDDSGPVPIAFVAVTVNVYAVPLVRLLIVALVAGGDPVTVVGVCAAEPMYGVTV